GRARALGREFLRPLGIEADRRGEAIPAAHAFFQKAWELGIGRLGSDAEDVRGDAGERTAARRGVLVAEELAYWDRGAAVALPGPGLGAPPVRRMGTPAQRARFLGPFRDPARPRWGRLRDDRAHRGKRRRRHPDACAAHG